MNKWAPLLEEFKDKLQSKVSERDENAYVELRIQPDNCVCLIHHTKGVEGYLIYEGMDGRLGYHGIS